MSVERGRMERAIHGELYRAAESLGAGSDLLGILGSWGDTASTEDVLQMLRAYNRSWDRMAAEQAAGAHP